jgi:hypothetical protein
MGVRINNGMKKDRHAEPKSVIHKSSDYKDSLFENCT